MAPINVFFISTRSCSSQNEALYLGTELRGESLLTFAFARLSNSVKYMGKDRLCSLNPRLFTSDRAKNFLKKEAVPNNSGQKEALRAENRRKRDISYTTYVCVR